MIGEGRWRRARTFSPSAEYGIPITADQDKYLALQKIINDIRKRNGEVQNPVGFTSAAQADDHLQESVGKDTFHVFKRSECGTELCLAFRMAIEKH
jgi:hypothetical protein